MKIARIKKPREFPYNKYTLSDKGYRFIAQIYEDGGGCYEVVKKGKQVYCREDATAGRKVE